MHQRMGFKQSALVSRCCDGCSGADSSSRLYVTPAPCGYLYFYRVFGVSSTSMEVLQRRLEVVASWQTMMMYPQNPLSCPQITRFSNLSTRRCLCDLWFLRVTTPATGNCTSLSRLILFMTTRCLQFGCFSFFVLLLWILLC